MQNRKDWSTREICCPKRPQCQFQPCRKFPYKYWKSYIFVKLSVTILRFVDKLCHKDLRKHQTACTTTNNKMMLSPLGRVTIVLLSQQNWKTGDKIGNFETPNQSTIKVRPKPYEVQRGHDTNLPAKLLHLGCSPF